MLKYSWIYLLTLPLSAAAIIALSSPDEKPYREKILDYINTHKLTEETKIQKDEPSADISNSSLTFKNTSESFGYKSGDWQKYIAFPEYGKISEEQKKTILIDTEDDVQVLSYGNMKLNLKYGGSVFTNDKYKQYDTDAPVSRLIQPGFLPEQQMQLHMEGKIGKRLTVYIDHDSNKKDNKYLMQYRAIREDELIREINAGDIDIKFNHSKYAVYDNTTSKGMGIDVTLKKSNLQIKAFGSISKGQTEIEYFRGNSAPGSNKLGEYNYIKKMFYQLEPFKRYDAKTTAPLEGEFATSVTITSNPSSPDTYSLTQVNIDPNSFELYMDPQSQYANLNSIQLSKVDTQGHYTKMMNGAEYTINYTTGVITFIRDIPANAKIFAVYTLAGGSTVTTDASAYPPLDIDHPGGQFSGKIFVFIKYGYSINEKTDGAYRSLPKGITVINDNKIHLDIYEIRSFYQIGDRQLLTDNFSLKFYNENQVIDQITEKKLGKYSIDYSKGLIQFTLREPFKTLLPSNFTPYIYSENQSSSAYQYSRYNIKIDYYKEARSFQLKHFNLIPNSVRVKVNDIEIAQGLYLVDHVSGFLMFLDSNNPVIGPETKIEIKYEYMPFMSQSQSFIGGVRVDYKLLDAVNFGGSILYSNSSGTTSIPTIGNTPNQLFLFEGDVSINLNEKKMAGLVNSISGSSYRTVPVEFNVYAEYARSYTTFNTFGKALIDNLESANDIIPISTSEKEWQLASMPSNGIIPIPTNSDRAMLNYYFYRDPSSPGTLFGPGYSATLVDYRIKSGPYNVATGHIPFNITPEASQRSLVFDMNFSYEGGSNDIASAAVRKLSTTAVDFSGLQYVEISYLYQGTADITINFDLGKINEDSDGNGILGTEDLNRNGILDSDPALNYYEDVGYDFFGYTFNGNATAKVGSGPRLSSATMGDGALNSEDLNGNGVLDTLESVYTINSATISSSSQWKTIVIPVDFSNSESNKAIMKQVESLRLYLRRTAGGTTGKLYIDNIKFVALKWNNIQKTAGDTFNVSIVNNISDAEYSSSSFILSNPEVFKQLYGEKSAQDLSKQTESSLQLVYNFASAPATNVSVTQRFQSTMDLRFYNTLNLWLNTRPTSSSGDQIGIIIGSSDSDYIEYKFNMSNDGAWREIKMKLKNGSSGSISGTVTGFPDMKRIIFMKVVIYNSALGDHGKVWIDNIYASEPDVLEDGAHWVETDLKITKPLFVTKDGTPVFSDFAIKYTTKGYGANFNTIGKKDSDISELYHELSSSVKIFPNWNTQFAMLIEDSSTDSLNDKVIDSKRGTRNYNSYFVASDYVSNINGVPTVKVSYKNDSYKQSVNERINSTLVNKTATSSIHTPLITIIEKIDNFLWGKINALFNMNMLFKEDNITRDTSFLPSNVSEKRQKSSAVLNLDYQNKYFYIQPNFSTASEEIVNGVSLQSLNNTEITGNVNGNFHFPFIYDGIDLKFVEKSMLTGFVIGINQSQYVSPQYKIDMNYLENRFRDFNFTNSPVPDFKRVKDARSYMSTQIALPINLYKIPETKFIKNFSFNYLRSLYLYESDIPYEGENVKQGSEQYGITRAFNTIADAALNIFQYWPGYFFTGRNNAASGRDYISGTINNHTSGTQYTGYNNTLRLLDNFSFNFTLDFDKIAVVSSLSLNQVSERLNVFGISQQVITFRYGINFTFDFMKLITTGVFFRPNQIGQPYHSLILDIGYAISDNMLITTNIEELVHSPLLGFSIKWGRANVGLKAGIDYKERYNKSFIVDDGGPDSIYAKNIPGNSFFKNSDFGFKLSFIYETDVTWLYNLFAGFYKLSGSPIFTFEYVMAINRYDYTLSVSPQPYDSYLFNMKLTLDLHKNIQGGIQSRFALEQYRSWLTAGISREVFSYELGLNFTLLF